MNPEIKAYSKKYTLKFKRPAGTSRGILTSKDVWIITVYNNSTGQKGIGECSPLWGLSIDRRDSYEQKLAEVCENTGDYDFYLEKGLKDYPSIRFGLEMALKNLTAGTEHLYFPSKFTLGQDYIEINGLVWMGEFEFMRKQIVEKIESGFSCIKLKIGAIDFQKEIELIKTIRREFTAEDIEIRVDANGAFTAEKALEKLKILSDYNLHSIEQPIRQGQWTEMAKLCETSPLAIALDEELIGITDTKRKVKMIKTIKPQYIILKPSLLGGFKASEEWIEIAGNNGTKWWITSALESNTGLNAIAQWTYTLGNKMPQGLGTGQLFSNNFYSPLYIEEGKLRFKPEYTTVNK